MCGDGDGDGDLREERRDEILGQSSGVKGHPQQVCTVCTSYGQKEGK